MPSDITTSSKVQTYSAISRKCPSSVWYNVSLVVPAVLFVVYLAVHSRKNVRKLCNGRSYVMISYYALLLLASFLNLAWCCLQAWQCSPEKEVSWNLLSLFTTSGLLCLEISLVAFFLRDSYASGLEALAHNFIISGIVVGIDLLFKSIVIFGFQIPLFIDVGSSYKAKWGLWSVDKVLLTAVYCFILFVHFSKWREKLPPRPAFHNYVIVMLATNAISLFACGLAGVGAGIGIWLYNLTILCYHSLYLPFLYITFLADFFQEEEFLLDNSYYSEMRDAGFFDTDWD